MPKKKETLRTEVHLMPEMYDQLRKLAECEHRTIKNYTEIIVMQHIETKTSNKPLSACTLCGKNIGNPPR